MDRLDPPRVHGHTPASVQGPNLLTITRLYAYCSRAAGLRLKSVVSVLLSGLGTNTDASQMSRTRTRWAHIDNVDAVTAAHTNHATETMRGDEIRGQEHGIKHRKYQDKLDHHVFLLQRRSP